MLKRIALTLLFCLISAHSWGGYELATSHGRAILSVTENEREYNVNLNIIPNKNWYIYSHQSGEFGLPAQIEWNLKDNILETEDWSEGEDIIYQGFSVNVYRSPASYTAKIYKNSADLPSFDLSWMACNDECIPEKIHFDFESESFAPPEEYTPAPATDIQPEMSFVAALMFAFLGGIILNLMPCVFPVLFIKIIGVVQDKTRRRRIVDALSYLAGVLTCFLIIAGILQFLKQQGTAIGWGFQLQSPWFVAVMAAVFFILFLSFLDVINFNIPLHYSFSGPFLTGLVAVLVASPCTAPFMGAAVGWILTANVSPIVFYTVFAALGLGYALPFFCAEFFPRVMQKVLPRPGRWMLWLKRAFAIPMLLTCLWLLWVLWGNVTAHNGLWQPYDRKKIETMSANGEKLFIDFTAKWCITCIVNEKTVLNTDKFMQLAKEKHIHLFKADWTNRSSEITSALAQYNRGSVPLYVYYDGTGKYEFLPQILTLKNVRRTIK